MIFFLFYIFYIEIEGKFGWIMGGGGAGQRVCWPPLKLSYAYDYALFVNLDVKVLNGKYTISL